MSSSFSRSQFYFTCAVGLCVFLYFVGLYSLNQVYMLSVDEFWFAHRIYQYSIAVPYRDFAPYKTVLGYYLLMPAFLRHGHVFEVLLFTKNIITLFNTIAFAIAALWLSRFFKKTSIVMSLLLLLSAEITLFYSSQIRVDLIGYWFAFFALLCLLEQRFFTAGMFLGFAFMTTQKTIWYLLASNIALGCYWLCYQRKLSDFFAIIKMDLTFVFLIIGYIVFWSLMSDFTTVYNSLFKEASTMYQLDWYDSGRYLYWQAVLAFNPLLFLLWPATIFCLLHKEEDQRIYRARFLIIIQGLIILCCLVPYKQVFPYYMQVTVPILFAVYCAFFSWLFDFYKSQNAILVASHKRIIWWALLYIYLILLVFCVIKFKLPVAYLIIGTVPSIIVLHLTHHLPYRLNNTLLLITLFFAGIIYPGLLLPKEIMAHNNNYQKEMIKRVEKLIAHDNNYVAGIELIYYIDQPIAGMRHLMGPAIDYLYHPTEKLKRVMLASLYLDPNASISTVIHDWSQTNILFYVNNYRMNALPLPIKNFLRDNYSHIGNSIYYYAPLVLAGNEIIDLKFNGQYQLSNAIEITLDNKKIKNGQMVYLQKGKHYSRSLNTYRLKLRPKDNKEFKFTEDLYNMVMY